MLKVAILGYGFRAKHYLNIINKTKEFKIILFYTLNEKEKEELNNLGYEVINDLMFLKNYEIDFIINVLNKKVNFKYSEELLKLGYYVLQETPYSIYLNDLNKNYSKLMIAEQYPYYPIMQIYKKIIDDNIIGEINKIDLSFAHDYHAISIIYHLFSLVEEPKINGFKYNDYVNKTITRYEEYHEENIIKSVAKHVTFMFKNNKIAIYDFNSEEYRSAIRKPYIHIYGTKGQIVNDKVYFLDNNYQYKVINIINKNEAYYFNNELVYLKNKDLSLDEEATYNILKEFKNIVINKLKIDNQKHILEAKISIIMNELGDINYEKS